MSPLAQKAPPARPYKGQSLLLALDDYVAVDIETTGLSPRYSAIIEVGAVRFRAGRPRDEVSLLINPGFDLPPAITELTGITDDMLWTAPPLADVLPYFLDFVGTDVILGHNVNFDVNFLYDKALSLGLAPVSNDFASGDGAPPAERPGGAVRRGTGHSPPGPGGLLHRRGLL